MCSEAIRSRVLELLLISTVSVWGYYEAPQLVNPNLRLAAMGDLSVVIEDIDNEINFYDFGRSAAGVIEDHAGMSQVYASALYGFAAYDEALYFRDGHGSALGVGGIVKYGGALAFGGSYSRSWGYYAYDTGYGLEECNTYTTADSVLLAYAIVPQLTAGVRGTYGNLYPGEYTLEPSVMIRRWPAWTFGFTYLLKKRGIATYHEFALPLVYANEVLKLGLIGRLQEGRYYDDENSISVRARWSFGKERNGGCIALASEYSTLEGTYDWGLRTVGGIALAGNRLWMVGMQYSWTIERIKYDDPMSLEMGYLDRHEGSANLGAEIFVLEFVALRVGYINMLFYSSRDIATSRRDYMTSGIGLKIPGADLSFDLAYNLKIWEYMYTDSTGYISLAHDGDNVFGVTCRYVF